MTATALGRAFLAIEPGFMTALTVFMGYLLVLAFSGMTAQTFCFLTGNIGTLFAIGSFGEKGLFMKRIVCKRKNSWKPLLKLFFCVGNYSFD